MAIVKLVLPKPVNTSLQAKASDVNTSTSNADNGAWDIMYFARIENGKQVGDIQRLGKCVSVETTLESDNYTVEVEVDDTAQTPVGGDFIFFGKENKVNISGIRGYFAEVEMRNDSTDQAKLFSVGSEMTQSSK